MYLKIESVEMLLVRATEAIEKSQNKVYLDKADTDKELVLAIRLLNLARFRIHESVPTKEDKAERTGTTDT
jgi:hypothetical protein